MMKRFTALTNTIGEQVSHIQKDAIDQMSNISKTLATRVEISNGSVAMEMMTHM